MISEEKRFLVPAERLFNVLFNGYGIAGRQWKFPQLFYA
jgi:hypothetical protein